MLDRSIPRLVAAAVLLGSLACVSPAFAADTPNAAPAPAPKMMMHKHHALRGDMHQRIEERIKTLHTKLNITPEQEPAWDRVAQAMRDSEVAVRELVRDRHENAETMTAVQDLESYQKIAEAHADGLKNVATAFSGLYDGMSDDQKMNADRIFGQFEGHEHGGKMNKNPAGK
jgi:protein CpxP